MKWVIFGIVLVLLWWFLGINLGRGRNRRDLAHFVTSLLVLLENGGILRVCRRGSKQRLEIVRVAGTDASAVIRIEVPREDWSRCCVTEIKKVAEAQVFDVAVCADRASAVLCETSVAVPDIWVEWSGARVAHLAGLLLDALSIPTNATLDFELIGPRSTRALHRSADDL